MPSVSGRRRSQHHYFGGKRGPSCVSAFGARARECPARIGPAERSAGRDARQTPAHPRTIRNRGGRGCSSGHGGEYKPPRFSGLPFSSFETGRRGLVRHQEGNRNSSFGAAQAYRLPPARAALRWIKHKRAQPGAIDLTRGGQGRSPAGRCLPAGPSSSSVAGTPKTTCACRGLNASGAARIFFRLTCRTPRSYPPCFRSIGFIRRGQCHFGGHTKTKVLLYQALVQKLGDRSHPGACRRSPGPAGNLQWTRRHAWTHSRTSGHTLGP